MPLNRQKEITAFLPLIIPGALSASVQSSFRAHLEGSIFNITTTSIRQFIVLVANCTGKSASVRESAYGAFSVYGKPNSLIQQEIRTSFRISIGKR
jgi:hypothetical protein